MRDWKWFTEEEVASWPTDHKKCRKCQTILPFDSFTKQKQTLFGLCNECKQCRKPRSKEQYWNTPLERIIFNRAKSRAKRSGVEFNIDLGDVIIPAACPIFGIEFERGSNWNNASLDRIDPSKGYVKGNVAVISLRANTIKNNATARELRAIADWIESQLPV